MELRTTNLLRLNFYRTAIFYNVFAVCVPLWRSVDEATGEGRKFVDAAVAEERPPAAYILAALQVDVDQIDAFFELDGAYLLRPWDRSSSNRTWLRPFASLVKARNRR